jgi:type I restriction enzyme S subunit
VKAGWQTKSLADTCNMYQPKTISGKEMQVDGAYPVFGANGIIGRYNQFNHAEPQLLITCRGATCGTVNVSLPNSWITGNAMVVRPKDDSIDLRYLEYYFRGGIDISTAITGAAQPQITRTNLEPLPIRLPNSLDEQRRIVAVLDKAFAGISTATANAQKNLSNARALFESLLDQTFEANDPEWRCELLNKICTIGDGNHSSKYPKSAEMVSAGVPFLRSTNVQDGKMSLHDVLYISPEKHRELKKGHLKTGDVLFTNRGEIGKVAMIEESLDGSNLNSQVAWLRSKGDVISEYLYFYLQSGRMKRHYQQTQSGTALQQFTIKMLQNVNVRFPSAVDQQRRLVERLKDFRRETENLEKNFNLRLAALSELKQSLLQKAFAGELT